VEGKIPQQLMSAVSTPTVAAHIIPFSIVPNDINDASQIERSSRIFEILWRFGGIELTELNGTKINRLENILTLSTETRDLFGRLDMWFEPIEVFSFISSQTPYQSCSSRASRTHIGCKRQIPRLQDLIMEQC